jgi:putative hemolysin
MWELAVMSGATKLTYSSPQDHVIKNVLIKSIERLTGQRKLENLYFDLINKPQPYRSMWEAALAQLQINLEYDEAQLARVPRSGPLIFIANHPYGLIDGLAICHLASKVQPQFKILINSVLAQEDWIAPYALPIDFHETKEAVQININSKRLAMQTLREGGLIVIFPAGGISTAKGLFGKVTDLEWKLFAAKLIQISQATVVPLYFHGHNSKLFQIVSQFSLTLRLSLIIHEVRNKIGESLQVTIGTPIPYAKIANIKKRKELIDYLREVTYGLAEEPNWS